MVASAVLHENSSAEMDLVRLGMQKEITIDRQEISSKGDILVLREDIQWQHRLRRTWDMLWLHTGALPFEYLHHGPVDCGSSSKIMY